MLVALVQITRLHYCTFDFFLSCPPKGIDMTIKYFREELEKTGEIVPTGPEASKPGLSETHERHGKMLRT